MIIPFSVSFRWTLLSSISHMSVSPPPFPPWFTESHHGVDDLPCDSLKNESYQRWTHPSTHNFPSSCISAHTLSPSSHLGRNVPDLVQGQHRDLWTGSHLHLANWDSPSPAPFISLSLQHDFHHVIIMLQFLPSSKNPSCLSSLYSHYVSAPTHNSFAKLLPHLLFYS